MQGIGGCRRVQFPYSHLGSRRVDFRLGKQTALVAGNGVKRPPIHVFQANHILPLVDIRGVIAGFSKFLISGIERGPGIQDDLGERFCRGIRGRTRQGRRVLSLTLAAVLELALAVALFWVLTVALLTYAVVPERLEIVTIGSPRSVALWKSRLRLSFRNYRLHQSYSTTVN